MNNEEKILSLLETLVTKVDALEAGQAKLTTDVSDLKAGQARLEERLDRVEDSLYQINDKLDDAEAKNANQHIRTRSAVEKIAMAVKENTSDITRLKTAQ